MEVKQLTQEQIKELWEWCGFKYIGKANVRDIWEAPDGGIYYDNLPPLDFNNLFKYSVPKALMELQRLGAVIPLIELFSRWYDKICAGYNYEDALFWVIWKVRGVIGLLELTPALTAELMKEQKDQDREWAAKIRALRMEATDTILEGCEVICIGAQSTDLITCPLSTDEQIKCPQRRQYQAGYDSRKDE